ncbi:MAG TPA: DUF3616 domain-containing protein [Parafilimonas sp.]|nr:DUF3616 domain-containing protein [Parafilimonas sp.]
MPQANFALFEFDLQLNQLSNNKKLSEGLSAVVLIGDEVWTANDETIALERLSCKNSNAGANKTYCQHAHFPLDKYLALPGGVQGEIDIEGLDYRDGYLWLIGSHSLSRKKAKKNDAVEENLKRLSEISKPEEIRNRYLLARIPLVEKDGNRVPEKQTQQNGITKTAAHLRLEDNGNQLTAMLAQDDHLKPFFAIPSKDNGFDIEGLAVTDDGRVFVGLRGPVLRGWAIILELRPEGENNSSVFELKDVDGNAANTTLCRKHFFELGGLGIRDLYIDGTDLLILAGPTMDLDGPVSIFRWKEGVKKTGVSFVSANNNNDELKKIIDIPYGSGEDHAEGMTSFSTVAGKTNSLMIVYDLAAKARQTAPANLIADIFELAI